MGNDAGLRFPSTFSESIYSVLLLNYKENRNTTQLPVVTVSNEAFTVKSGQNEQKCIDVLYLILKILGMRVNPTSICFCKCHFWDVVIFSNNCSTVVACHDHRQEVGWTKRTQ